MNRDEIVVAAHAVVESRGHEALSMRGLARELGVSAPALYEHVDSLDHILRLLAEQGYDQLGERWNGIAGSEIDWLLATGKAYVAFAVERPKLFVLMHRFSPGAILGDPDIEHPAATSLFDHGLAHIRAAMDAGDLAEADPLDVALALWAAAHGVASVAVMTPGLDATHLSEQVIGGLLRGLGSRPS